MSATTSWPYDNPSDPEFQAWCLAQWRLVREGGVWIVPRSGLVFEKRGRTFALIAERAGRQDDEFELIRRHFAAVGIDVVRDV